MRIHELDLPIGKSFSLKMKGLDYKEHQFDARLIGFEQGQSVMVAIPAKPGQILLQTGMDVTIEARLPEGYVRFETEILSICDSPFQYLHLEYPLGVNYQKLREHVRIGVDEPVEVNAHTGLGMTTSAIHGYILDISFEGARLVVEKELTSMVTKISVGITLRSEELKHDMTLSAEIREASRLSDDHPDYKFAYGIHFIDLEPMDSLFLRSFCLQEKVLGHAQLC